MERLAAVAAARSPRGGGPPPPERRCASLLCPRRAKLHCTALGAHISRHVATPRIRLLQVDLRLAAMATWGEACALSAVCCRVSPRHGGGTAFSFEAVGEVEQILMDLDCSFYIPEAEIIRRTKMDLPGMFSEFLRNMRHGRKTQNGCIFGFPACPALSDFPASLPCTPAIRALPACPACLPPLPVSLSPCLRALPCLAALPCLPALPIYPLLCSPSLASPRLSSPLLASPRLSSPLCASPRLASPRLASPRLASPRLSSPLLASPLLS
jgi:hypothetical protein